MSGELSHFEELSAKTPMKQPVALIVGMMLLPGLLWLINFLAPNEGVEDLKSGQGDAEQAAQVQAEEDLEI